jgi:hypothetical protein
VADELSELRIALGARVETCWERLDDAVSELVSLHDVSPESIVARVGESTTAERGAEAAPSRSR